MSKPKVTYNRLAVNVTNSNFWGQSTTTIISIDDGFYAILNEARLILNLTATGAPTLALTFIKPPLAWINTANTTIQYFGEGGGTVTESYSTQSNRGDVGVVLELLDLTSAGWTQNNNFEYNNTAVAPTTTAIGHTNTFEVAIPLRYLIDPCVTKKFLPVKTLTFTPNWRSLLECINPNIAGNVAVFNVIMNSMYVCYPTVSMHPAPDIGLRLPDLRGIYILPINKSADSTQTSVTITVPGKPVYLYHFFLTSVASAAAGGAVPANGKYTLANAGSGVVSFQQVNLGGKSFPLNPQYGTGNIAATYSSNVAAFYHELQCISNNFASGQDTFLTYDLWKNNFRIYAIDLSDSDSTFGTFQFNAQYERIVGDATTHIIFAMYIPH